MTERYFNILREIKSVTQKQVEHNPLYVKIKLSGFVYKCLAV